MKVITKNNYAKGGSLKAHGIEIGDTFIKTISGNIQKVKDKKGKIVYVDLSTGERDAQPPLPFENGGGVQDEVYIKYLNKDKKFKEDIKYFKSYDEARKWGRENLENFNSDMINFKFENGGGIGMEEDIDLTDDKRLRVGKPAMPTRKLSNQEIAEKYNANAYEFMQSDKFKNGGALVGNQKRIDMNKNGKIDSEDFKLLRSSMNGAYRNERKHVNHNEDYEVRYARKKPNRTGYKGKRKFATGGGISNFERFSNIVAKNYEGKRVKPKYQKEYGKTYSKSEAKEVGNKVAGKMKMMKKAESGAEVKKGNRGGLMVLAKKIRKDGESWKDALKRAGQQLK